MSNITTCFGFAQMSSKADMFVTIDDAVIDKMWGLCAGAFIYEGCSKLLRDGRPCALGRHKRRLRRRDPESPVGIHSRGRASHECDMDGDGTYMYCFAIQVGDTVIQVNEDCGKKLIGMSGEEFHKEHGTSNDISEVFDQVQSAIWTVSYVFDDFLHCKAVNIVKKDQTEKKLILEFVEPARNRKHKGAGESSKQDVPGQEFSEELLFSLKSIRIKGA